MFPIVKTWDPKWKSNEKGWFIPLKWMNWFSVQMGVDPGLCHGIQAPGGGGDSEAASKSLETCRVKRPRLGQWHQIAVGAFNDYFYRDPYDP